MQVKRSFWILVALVLCCALPASGAGGASGWIVMDFDLSRHPTGAPAALWVPYPVSGPYQDITDIWVETDAPGWAVYTDKVYGTPMLHVRWPEGARSRILKMISHVERREVARRDFPEREGPWDPSDYALWLRPTRLGPVDGPVKALADRITRGRTGVLQKAKAVYDWICDNMYRDPATRGCGRGDVCALLERPGGKCTDIHSVFVALCRAAGVPAREIFGLRLGREPVVDVTRWQHCWAEFFLPGYGWVPVDPADVRKIMLKKGLTLKDPETRRWRDYFWGGWDPYRVRLAVGRDLILNPPQQGPPLNTFGYPYAEVGGQPLDALDPDSFRYTITYRQHL